MNDCESAYSVFVGGGQVWSASCKNLKQGLKLGLYTAPLLEASKDMIKRCITSLPHEKGRQWRTSRSKSQRKVWMVEFQLQYHAYTTPVIEDKDIIYYPGKKISALLTQRTRWIAIGQLRFSPYTGIQKTRLISSLLDSTSLVNQVITVWCSEHHLTPPQIALGLYWAQDRYKNSRNRPFLLSNRLDYMRFVWILRENHQTNYGSVEWINDKL